MSDVSYFENTWGKMPDEKLFEVLAHRDGYRPELVEFIEREVARRNLDAQRISELENAATREKIEASEKSELPLQWPLRILMMLASFGIPQIALWAYYNHSGYIRRSREVWKWMTYGLVLWIGIIILLEVAI